MENKNKIRILEKRKVELIKNIQLCKLNKEKIAKTIINLKSQYKNGIISYSDYDSRLRGILKQRTPEQWITYYDNCIEHYKQEIISCDKDIKSENNNTKIINIVLISLFVLSLFAGLYIMKTTITGFVIQDNSIKFDRTLICDKCGAHKAPPLTDITMTITANFAGTSENDTLIDYFSKEWSIIDASGGIVEEYDEYYNRIIWNVNNDTETLSRTYIIRSPDKTTPPTDYEFHTGLANSTSDSWRVIVADPQAAPGMPNGGIELRVQACAAKDVTTVWGATSCNGTYPSSCANATTNDLLSCNDAFKETHSIIRYAQGGAHVQIYNKTITDCASLKDVYICWEWWVDAGTMNSPFVAVDANGNASFVNISTSAPGSSANPGLTCTNVTSNENWICQNFFQKTGTRAVARMATTRSNVGTSYLSIDNIFFNVTYVKNNTEYPKFSNFAVNQTFVGLGEYVNFSLSITDGNDTITAVNGTINGVNYTFTNTAGSNWDYDWNCTASNEGVNFTSAWARDLGSFPQFENTTSITGIKTACDATAPSITKAKINITSPINTNSWIKVNASVIDNRINNVTLRVTTPTITYNATLLNNGNEWYNDSILLNEAGVWNFTFYANDTVGNNAVPVFAVDGNGDNNITINTGFSNVAPIIGNVSLPQVDWSITEAGKSFVYFSFIATDGNGANDLNNITAEGITNATISGTSTTRYNTSCTAIGNVGEVSINYTCEVDIWYWDMNGTWSINASICDDNNVCAQNVTANFSLGATASIQIAPTAINFGTIAYGTSNITSLTGIIINNSGNVNVSMGNVRVTAIDLAGPDTKTISAENFTIGIYSGLNSCDFSNQSKQMVNNTATGITWAGLERGNLSINSIIAREELYFCLYKTIQSYLTAQTYDTTAGGSWIIDVI